MVYCVSSLVLVSSTAHNTLIYQITAAAPQTSMFVFALRTHTDHHRPHTVDATKIIIISCSERELCPIASRNENNLQKFRILFRIETIKMHCAACVEAKEEQKKKERNIESKFNARENYYLMFIILYLVKLKTQTRKSLILIFVAVCASVCV